MGKTIKNFCCGVAFPSKQRLSEHRRENGCKTNSIGRPTAASMAPKINDQACPARGDPEKGFYLAPVPHQSVGVSYATKKQRSKALRLRGYLKETDMPSNYNVKQEPANIILPGGF